MYRLCTGNQRRTGPLKIVASTVQIILSVSLDPVSDSDPFSGLDSEPDPERLFLILIPQGIRIRKSRCGSFHLSVKICNNNGANQLPPFPSTPHLIVVAWSLVARKAARVKYKADSEGVRPFLESSQPAVKKQRQIYFVPLKDTFFVIFERHINLEV